MIPMKLFILTFLGALCLAEAGLRKHQKLAKQHDSSSMSRRLNSESCLVLKSRIEYENTVLNQDEEKEICSCELDDGTIAELINLGKVCSNLVSSVSVITSKAGISFDAATQEASIPFGAAIETSTVEEEDSWRRRRLAVTGDKKILIVRAVAPDSSTESTEAKLKEEILGVGGTDVVNLSSQYSACSYGQLTFSASTLGNDGSHTVNISVNVNGADNSVIRGAMSSEAESDLNIQAARNAGTLDYVLLCIPPGTSGGWIAYAYINSYLSVYNNRWCEYPSGLMHEIGHNLGLAHSGEGGNSYGDQSGMMGYSYGQDEGPIMCFNGAKAYQLGWFPDFSQRVESDDPFNWQGDLIGFVDRDDAEECGVEGKNCDALNFRLTPSTGNEYYVHFNRREGFNSGTKEGGDQVLVVSRPQGVDYGASLLQAKLSTNDQYTIQNFGNYGSLIISVGAITLNSGSKSWADVTIQYGPASTDAPVISPTNAPVVSPTDTPVVAPTNAPIVPPTNSPIVPPTDAPVITPTNAPVLVNTDAPVVTPTDAPVVSPTDAPVVSPTPAPVACTLCTDEETPWMTSNGVDCIATELTNTKCNKNQKWNNNKFCQYSCFIEGNGYTGDNCCVVPTPAPAPTPPAPCTQCTDDETPWMISNGVDCITTGLIDSKCNKNQNWKRQKFCQYSCFIEGNGYAGDNCCVVPTPAPAPTPPAPCTQCTDDETPWMIRNEKDCTTSDLLSTKCNKSRYWRREGFCQISCFKNDSGYVGDNCCSNAGSE